VNGAAITAVNPTLIAFNVALSIPGQWKIAVTNPTAEPSLPFAFTVTGPPNIEGAEPTPLTHGAAEQTWKFTGTGFMSGLAVALTLDSGPANAPAPVAITATPISVASTAVVVKAILPVAGRLQAIITNPGGHASAAYTTNVT